MSFCIVSTEMIAMEMIARGQVQPKIVFGRYQFHRQSSGYEIQYEDPLTSSSVGIFFRIIFSISLFFTPLAVQE